MLRTSSTAFTSWPVMGWNCSGAHAVGMEAGEGYTLPITHDRKAQLAAVLSGRAWSKISLAVRALDSSALRDGRQRNSGETFRSLLPS